MKTLLTLLAAFMLAVQVQAVTGRQAFVRLDTPALNLLTDNMRRDLLSYYDADTLRQVPNALGGMSQLTRPLTDSYLKVRITPVSTLAIKVLPCRKDTIVATIYTIAAPGHAADSEVCFYDSDMRKLSTKRFMKLARIDEFIDTPDNHEGRCMKKELLGLIPYLTVEYTFTPEGDAITAQLTVSDYLGAEVTTQLERYIRPRLTYLWTGQKYELQKK